METKGIIMFNRGEQMIVRILVSLYSLRKFYSGNVSFYVENPCPCSNELDGALKYFGCNIIHLPDRHDYKTLIRKTSLFGSMGTANYDRTLWLDTDTVILNPIDEMFNYLDDSDLVIPHFCHWYSDGRAISKRIKKFKGLVDQKYIDEALKHHPAINTGVLSFRNTDKWKKFVDDVWLPISSNAANNKVFIADEVGLQVLMPSLEEWNIKLKIAPIGYNMSVLHDHDQSKEKYIVHMHGDKHVLDTGNSKYWKDIFEEMCSQNICNINSFLKYSDKRLVQYIAKKDTPVKNNHQTSDVTIVTAIDEYYLPILQVTFPNWRKYKNIDNNPIIVFINGIDIEKDSRLDFLRLPNITMVKWDESCLEKVDSHRELMLSAFVFGVSDYVKTDYWIKLDSDSYSTNFLPLYNEDFKKYSIISHKWTYSRPSHIEALDKWASTHWHKKINDGKPMINQGRVDGNRFYHNKKRFISYICFQRTRFTKYCVKMLDKRRLPAPTQDTFAYYLIQKLKPEEMGIGNFKKDNGFTQGNGKLGVDHIKKCLENVELQNEKELDSDYKDEVDQIDERDEIDEIAGIDILENKECEQNYIDKVIHSSLGNKNLEYEVEIKEK